MPPRRKDEEIIELYKKGEERIFKELVDKYSSPLFNFVAQMVGAGNAADITQESFIKAWKNLKGFDPDKASFKTWLFAIAKNTTTDFLRKKKSVVFSDLASKDGEDYFAESIPDEKLLPDEALQKLQDAQILKNLLRELPEIYKSVLLLRYQEDMTFEEIGRILNKPSNTVKSHHHRAIVRLRELLVNMHQN